jgi:acyl-[acyl-carrier-protein] desaturase
MPGAVIPNFMRRSFEIAKAGVYNLRVHCDRVIQPLIQQWGISELTGLSSEGSHLQEKIMAIPAQLSLRAEKFEARYSPAVV